MQRSRISQAIERFFITHHNYSMQTKGFTLIELLVVIAIVAVLSVVVVLALNPAELLRQARDSNRISDLANLRSALTFYSTDVSGSPSYSLGNGTLCYVDQTLATPFATPGCGAGGAYTKRFAAGTTTANQATTSSLKLVNATGWIPVNFTLISSGAPLSALPIDPAPSVANNLFYAYRPGGNGATCTAVASTCTTYEVTAHMESGKYQNGGSADVESTDGGVVSSTYEVGTYPGLNL